MTNLIYRGMKHDGERTAISHKPRNLIYRSVAHDGLPTAAMPVRNSHADLCYRGICYTLAANGDVLSGAQTLSDIVVRRGKEASILELPNNSATTRS
ncbi:DUF4278 domain-containing protein [Pseudotabrizicola sediminis]|uniref:DUF4278 domain-containing protein n=1 Tax=Pseudotabrizicola sediminis TaxID=2486418 RepID=A0ABY2KGV4_9RHOB|nr:DUF4278 domain-containing protein [Pseudotabrizicola sediminis]TGD41466.1 DUF4278 domain-containing protein [Pseudotabrizicola sediminis]